MMKWTKFYSEKTGNGPSHNTGLTSLHFELLNSDSADTHVSSIVLSNSDSADTQVSKESSPLLIPASRCSGTVDSIEESQDSWIELDPRTSIFLDVILILSWHNLNVDV